MNKLEKIALGISIAVIGFFVIGIGSVAVWQWSDPEGYAERQKEREIEIKAEELEMKQKVMEQKIVQTSEEEMRVNELALRESLKNYETPKTKENFESALPESCNRVNSMELSLYSTGKQCFDELNQRVEKWCYVQHNGNKALADDCRTQFYLKLADTCKDPVIGSVEVCLMHTLKELYPKLVP